MIQDHPSLVQAASYIAAAIAKEGGQGRQSTRNRSRMDGDDYDSDDELRGMESGVWSWSVVCCQTQNWQKYLTLTLILYVPEGT